MKERENVVVYSGRARKLLYEYLLAVEEDCIESGQEFDKRIKDQTEYLVICAYINRLTKEIRERMGSPKSYKTLEEAIKKAQEEQHGVSSFPNKRYRNDFDSDKKLDRQGEQGFPTELQ